MTRSQKVIPEAVCAPVTAEQGTEVRVLEAFLLLLEDQVLSINGGSQQRASLRTLKVLFTSRSKGLCFRKAEVQLGQLRTWMEGWQKGTFYLALFFLLSQQEGALLLQGCSNQEMETMHSKLMANTCRVRGLNKKWSEAKVCLTLSTDP